MINHNTKLNKKKTSLFFTLGIIIIATITIILTINSSYSYQNKKNDTISKIKEDSKQSIESIKNNIQNLITSYSINEYEKIIFNEIKNEDIFAIVLKDYNMGKILASEFYMTGKIKLSNSEIIDYDSTDPKQNQLLRNTFFTTSSDIFDLSNSKIGTISIYINDNKINEELSQIIKQTILHTLLVSILLILILFLTLKYYILNPISNIIHAIDNSDNKGIPKDLIPDSNNKEINALSTSMNNMISSIKKSREILERNQYKLEYLLELSPIAVRIAKDKGECVIFANHAYSRLLHKDEKTIHGNNPKEYYVDKDIYEDIVQTIERGEHIYNTLVELNIENNIVWALASYMNIGYDGENSHNR